MVAPFDDDQPLREKNGETRKPTSQKRRLDLQENNVPTQKAI